MFRRMRILRLPRPRHLLPVRHRLPSPSRALTTLAIETSCDDTAVAVLTRSDGHEDLNHGRENGSGNGSGNGKGKGKGGEDGGRPTYSYRLLFNERIVSDNRAFRGINPVVAVQGHNAALAKLVSRAVRVAAESVASSGGGSVGSPGLDARTGSIAWRPDFVCATRGPGIMSNLAVGLNMAKGLAVAWGVPLLGVHHMQAHALTPRLVDALGMNDGHHHGHEDASSGAGAGAADHHRRDAGRGAEGNASAGRVDFPFLSLLVSGGHTQLVLSEGVAAHRILAATADVALGNFLDHAAREILPREVLEGSADVMYGRLLEAFAFGDDSNTNSSAIPGEGDGADPYAFFEPARSRGDEAVPQDTGYAWDIPLPLKGSRKLAFTFASFRTAVEAVAGGASGMKTSTGMNTGESTTRSPGESPGLDHAERVALARHAMRAAFQHVAGRVVLALQDTPGLAARARTLVVAGGVASNRFLMHVLRSTLAARGLGGVRVVAPPPALCTDNAAMVAWAGMEMWDAGWCSDLGVLPVGRWPMEVEGGDGIMGAGGWLRRDGVKRE